MASGIYEIRNTLNGKRYIGSAVEFGNRWRVHSQSLQRGDHHSRQLQRAWRKYTPAAFQFNKILECAPEHLLMYEQRLIDGLKPEYNTNPTAGSMLGFKHSEESRAKMQASRMAYDFSYWRGKTRSEETKAKISASRKGKGGGPRSPERLAKISAALKGRIITDEQRAKISQALTGKTTGRGKLTNDQVRNIRRLHDEGKQQFEIADALSIPRKYVHTVVRGHGYTWVE